MDNNHWNVGYGIRPVFRNYTWKASYFSPIQFGHSFWVLVDLKFVNGPIELPV